MDNNVNVWMKIMSLKIASVKCSLISRSMHTPMDNLCEWLTLINSLYDQCGSYYDLSYLNSWIRAPAQLYFISS